MKNTKMLVALLVTGLIASPGVASETGDGGRGEQESLAGEAEGTSKPCPPRYGDGLVCHGLKNAEVKVRWGPGRPVTAKHRLGCL